MKAQKHTFTVEQEQAGSRLDQFLLSQLDGCTRNYIQKLIADNRVTLERKKRIKKHEKLKEGDKVVVNIPKTEELEMKGEKIPLDIIYEDADFLILNKPAGLIVHPASDKAHHQSGTLVNALLAHCGDSLSGIGGVKRPGIVHRLDKDTSGIMICTKNDESHQYFSQLFEKREITKVYLALVKGKLPAKSGKIDAPIGRSAVNRTKMDVSMHGRHAVTNFKIVKEFDNCTLVEAHIETGRTHQIRVHFASIGHPIVGDPTYGERYLNKKFREEHGLDRQFLHAHVLKFKMPKTKRERKFEAKIPKDLSKILDNLS